MKSRVTAFTLVEMMVTLTLTAIVLVMVGYAFRTVLTLRETVSSNLTLNESTYMLMADVERSFTNAQITTKQFNSLKLDGIRFDFEVDHAIRSQAHRSDTLSNFLTSPVLGSLQPKTDGGVPKDSISFSLQGGRHTIWRESSLAEHINTTIRNGAIRP